MAAGRIQFRLRMDAALNWTMPKTTATQATDGGRPLLGKDWQPLQRSLFAPMYEADFNADEREVAIYLDADEALTWWHRNVAKSQYALQGWKREKIYPDFLFALKVDGGVQRIVALETKGDQLSGNIDTEYKRAVLGLLSETFAMDRITPVGRLELADGERTVVECDLVLMSEWRSKLPKIIARSGSGVAS